MRQHPVYNNGKSIPLLPQKALLLFQGDSICLLKNKNKTQLPTKLENGQGLRDEEEESDSS